MQSKLWICLIFILFGFSSSVDAQDCECKSYEENRTLIDSLIDIAEYDKVLKYSTQMIKEGSASCSAFGYGYVTEILIKQGNLDSAGKLLEFNDIYFRKSKCPNANKYRFLTQQAEYYFFQNNYERSLEYALEMMEIAIAEKNSVHKAECNLRVANIFVKMSQPEKARQYAVVARQTIDKLPESYKKYHLYNALSNRYNNLFQDFKEPKYLDTVEMFMSGIRRHAIKLGPTNRLLEQYYRKKAFLSLKAKKLPVSLQYLDSALAIVRVFPMKGELYSINGDKANVFRKLKDFKTAEVFADSCLYYAKKENIVSAIINGYDIIYMVARDAGNSDKALKAFESMTLINDSIIDVKNTGKIAELEQKYNKVQNEKTIRELNQESEIKNLRIKILVIGIALAGLVLAIIIFLYRQNIVRNKQKILEVEQRLNRSRINPHFFFNAITTLQGIAVKENDGKIVARNLYKFSSLMRQTLEGSYNDYVSIDTELEFIRNYVELQQLKEHGRFEFEVQLNEDVESSDTLVPAMLIQPFLENSIEHGFRNINYTGKIELSISIKNASLQIFVKDNGVGLGSETKENKHISRAMQITKDRLFLLNKEKNSSATFVVGQNSPNGVTVEILLPLLYK
jgi:hypothetical protein